MGIKNPKFSPKNNERNADCVKRRNHVLRSPLLGLRCLLISRGPTLKMKGVHISRCPHGIMVRHRSQYVGPDHVISDIRDDGIPKVEYVPKFWSLVSSFPLRWESQIQIPTSDLSKHCATFEWWHRARKPTLSIGPTGALAREYVKPMKWDCFQRKGRNTVRCRSIESDALSDANSQRTVAAPANRTWRCGRRSFVRLARLCRNNTRINRKCKAVIVVGGNMGVQINDFSRFIVAGNLSFLRFWWNMQWSVWWIRLQYIRQQ